MALSNCERCRHLVLRQDDDIEDLQWRTCPLQKDYISLFNLLKLDSPPARFIYDCPSFDRHTQFEQWLEQVDAAIAQRQGGKRLCELSLQLEERSDAIFRTYFESIAAFTPIALVANLILTDCFEAERC